MNETKIFEVVIDGAIQPEVFEDEESANTYGAQRRGPDGINKKIVVYEVGSYRHTKAFAAGFTPRNPKTNDVDPKKKPKG